MTSKYLIPLLTSGILAYSVSPAWGQENTAPEINFNGTKYLNIQF